MVNQSESMLYPGELCIKYCGYWRTWNRVLYMDNKGHMVEVNLSPINPHMKDGWMDNVRPIMIRWHCTRFDPFHDRMYRNVVKNRHSAVFQTIRDKMLNNLPIEVVHRLLNEDILPQINWVEYTMNSQRGGGVPFAVCKRSGGIETVVEDLPQSNPLEKEILRDGPLVRREILS